MRTFGAFMFGMLVGAFINQWYQPANVDLNEASKCIRVCLANRLIDPNSDASKALQDDMKFCDDKHLCDIRRIR